MAALDYTRLDRPDISMNSFYPRRNWTDTPPGAQDHTIPVGPDVSLSARFFPADVGIASILYFYGNGETAADYDDIALWYNSVGVNFFVVDYRGYGMSGGSPAFSTMLSDAWQALDYLEKMLSEGEYRGGLFVMGRSMGRHAAFELAAGSRHRRDGRAGSGQVDRRRDYRKRPSDLGSIHPRAAAGGSRRLPGGLPGESQIDFPAGTGDSRRGRHPGAPPGGCRDVR